MATVASVRPGSVGELLRQWRERRRLSFVETGRVTPSRGMVLQLASALEVPLRERNHLLLARGRYPGGVDEELEYEVARKAAAWLEPVFANRQMLDLGALPHALEVEGPDPEDRPDEVFAAPVALPSGARFLHAAGEGDYLDQVIDRGELEWWLDGELIVPHRGRLLRYRAELLFVFAEGLYLPRRIRIVSALPRVDAEMAAGPAPASLRYDRLFPA